MGIQPAEKMSSNAIKSSAMRLSVSSSVCAPDTHM